MVLSWSDLRLMMIRMARALHVKSTFRGLEFSQELDHVTW